MSGKPRITVKYKDEPAPETWRSVESYAHRYAKETVYNWFREKWERNHKEGYHNNYYMFDWVADETDRERGVRMEYPIISRRVASGQVEVYGVNPVWSDYPDLNKIQNMGRKIGAVLDIAICSEGRIKYGIEIVYKHRTPKSKIKFLQEQGIRGYEISAMWVLNQVKCPPSLQLTNIC